ncbi:MAG: tetratricopeptide repeat protein [Planctomycetota bacterium]
MSRHRSARWPWLALGLVLVCALAGGCRRVSGVEDLRRFEEACGQFEQARDPDDFLRVASLFESILERGGESGVVLYNLGNAYLRAGRAGLAIAAYRRAQRYMPRDEFLADNLAQALGPDRARAASERTLLEHVLFWQRSVSYPEKLLGVCLAATLAFLLGIGACLVKSRQRLLRRSSWVALGITLVLGVSAGLDVYDVEILRHGVVTVPEVIARKGDAESYAPAFTEPLEDGTEFLVIEERGDWLRVRLPGRLEGWVPRFKTVVY